MQRLVTDACFLISAIRSCDPNHNVCYNFFKNHEDSTTWVVPIIAYFEYQATQSRLQREGKKAYRELYIPNQEIYNVSLDLVHKTAEQNLANIFSELRGADLVYACIAKIENIPLVTCDNHFNSYIGQISIINPLKDDN